MSDQLLDQMYQSDYALITAQLSLANGRFLQPTGFPDIGACIYRDKDGKRWCLVESEQSMANRLEAVCTKNPGIWVDELKGLPLVTVKDKKGVRLATNLTEPHRIASSYVLEGKLNDGQHLRTKIELKLGLLDGGDFWPLDKRADLERLVFALDPSALLHGFQFVQWKFVGLRQTRLLHARLEAELADEPEVHYGMVKWDPIEPDSTREERANKGQSIAAKSRVVAKNIVATFEIDLLSLKTLALEEEQKKFLLGLALWKIGSFLANMPAFDARSRQTIPSLRLRADCYLECGRVELRVRERSGSQTHSSTTPVSREELIGAMPKEQQRPDFVKLVSDVLGVKPEPDPGLYEGPVLAVTYERKDKAGKNSTQGGSPT